MHVPMTPSLTLNTKLPRTTTQGAAAADATAGPTAVEGVDTPSLPTVAKAAGASNVTTLGALSSAAFILAVLLQTLG